MLPQDAQDEFLMTRLKQEQRFAPLGERMKRRVTLYAIGGALGLLVINLVLTPVRLDLFPVQLILGAIYGVIIAYKRLIGLANGLVFMGIGLSSMLVTGHTAILTFAGMVSCAFYFIAGLAVGIGEASKLADGS